MAFDPRTNELAILGEGSKSKTLPGLSLTLWSAQGPQIKLVHSLGMTAVGQMDGWYDLGSIPPDKPPNICMQSLRQPSEEPLPSACLVFSPSSEFLAVASQTQG